MALTLSQEDFQALARMNLGCNRAFWVASDGSDSNNGLSPALPKLTVESLLQVNSVGVTAGDAVIIGPGDFEAQTQIEFPVDVKVIGAGMDVTRIIVDCTSLDEENGTYVSGGNVLIRDLTIRATGNGQAVSTDGVGVRIDTTLSAGTVMDRVSFERVHIYGESDSLRGYFTNLRLLDCKLTGRWDALVADSSSCTVLMQGGLIELLNPKSSSYQFHAAGGESVLRNVIMRGSGGSSVTCQGVTAAASCRAELINCTIDVSRASSSSKAITNSAGAILVYGSSYDPDKTSGTITQIPFHQIGSAAETAASEIWSYSDRTLTRRSVSAAPDAQVERRELVRGNDYGSSARQFLITITDGAPWPTDLSDYTWTVEFERHEDNNADAADDHLSATAGVVTATGSSRSLSLNCASSVTANAWGLYKWTVRGTLTDSPNTVWDVELGEIEILDSAAEYE